MFPSLKALLLLVNFLLASSQEVVTIADGTQFKGTSNGIIRSFKGIRYAESPVGKLRWAPPVAYTNPNVENIVDATKYGSHCIQSVWPNGSEDCLFLNIFVAENISSSASLPVVIFIHGGSYVSGSSKFYPGEDMVEYWQGSAIVVTLDYRLNVFGFLGSEDLRVQDKDSGSCGNYGLQDQRMGFEWTRKNIGIFILHIALLPLIHVRISIFRRGPYTHHYYGRIGRWWFSLQSSHDEEILVVFHICDH
jgi:carboxylesterase type B